MDHDGDGKGDACDPDLDNDGVPNERDNCIFYYNPGKIISACFFYKLFLKHSFKLILDQMDLNNDGIGDVCEEDSDHDNVPNYLDNCPNNSKIFSTDFRTYQVCRIFQNHLLTFLAKKN